MIQPRKSSLANDWNRFGFLRVGTIVPEHRVAHVAFNLAQTRAALAQAVKEGVQLAVFPELGITAYSCADLFYQASLRAEAEQALISLSAATAKLPIVAIVGLPVAVQGRLYNCAAFIGGGKILGVVPKIHLPTTQEFYEERWFTSGRLANVTEIILGGEKVPFGIDLLFQAANLPDCRVGIELCEDLWAVQPPSGPQALAGATVLVNLSASNETLGKSDYRRALVLQQSARCLAAYLYASAGPGESSTDTVYSGHALIAENGTLLAEGERFSFQTSLTVADIDVQRLQHERLRNSSYSADAAGDAGKWRIISFTLPLLGHQQLRRSISPAPFVPENPQRRSEYCQEIFAIQTAGLEKRLRTTRSKTVVVGVSGGLDSTLALLVIARVFDRLALPRRQILAVTMPGFGTTTRTRQNAGKLVELLGTTLRSVSIEKSVRQHFADIGHQESQHNVVYENAQARERTQILMDLANQGGGLVVGTGDLSEAALGWCTFNGDHMSMYHVNAGVPKTLVRYLIDWTAESEFTGPIAAILHDVASTPISPELLPLNRKGQLQQKTEETVGPYELHDFYLYYFVRHQFSAEKILYLAEQAFAKRYPRTILQKWLKIFLTRFVQQQFKRSSMPDGPKVGSVALSPRADWRMPSDAESDPWKSV